MLAAAGCTAGWAEAARSTAPAQQARAAPGLQLRAMPFTEQTFNNCGPQSIASVMGYYGVQVVQAQVTKATPQGYMTAQAIGQFVAPYGLGARRFVGGRVPHLRSLIVLGVPVIVLQWLKPGSAVPHFRVVTGFDDARQMVQTLDPLLGPRMLIPYRAFEGLWTVNRAEFIPVYPLKNEARVLRVLGL
jgi:ABC-type bacteriocin/lantibiotic exporter with double-glycine peptidase domain